MPTSISRWHLFCQFVFCCALRAFLSLFDCADAPTIVSSYIGSRGSSTISGFGPSSVSKMMFSLAKSASLYCTLHFSQRSGRFVVGLSQKGSIPRGVLYHADCAISYFIILLWWFAVRDYRENIIWLFAARDLLSLLFRLLAEREIKRRFCKLNWVAESQNNEINKLKPLGNNVNAWSDMSDHEAGN